MRRGKNMAKFNGNIFRSDAAKDKNEIQKCSIYLQECLSNDDYKRLESDFRKSNDDNMSWWEFVVKNVSVVYKH
jgi:hypothetical protein